jgi:hypothetical protein
MRRNEAEGSGTEFSMEALHQVIRAFVGILGVIAIIIGLLYAARTFHLIYSALSGPEAMHSIVARWASAVGEKEFDFVISGNTYHLANAVAIVVLGGGAVVLAWISMGLILTGTKVVSWMVGERQAIKEILTHAFGPLGRPSGPPAEGGGGQSP